MTKPPPLQMRPQARPDEVEYYNDLPGKSPPDVSTARRQLKHDKLPRGLKHFNWLSDI